MAKQSPRFKYYAQNQMSLIPHSLDDFIPKLHPVRIINTVIDKLDLESLYDSYSKCGGISYHPKMLLKVLIYGYLNNVYSSRKLEQACLENVHYMWLSGMSYPDHNTINRFRSSKLKGYIEQIFTQIVELFIAEGFISIEEAYIDGTKIEANANKFTFVWKKAISNYKEKMVQQILEIWGYADSIARQESELPPPPDFKKIDTEAISQAIDTLNAALKDNPDVDQKVKNKLKYITKEYPTKIQEYQEHEAILEDRNSYSKTDKDATFMRMKEDHMNSGFLKAGYNVQISTNNQYILAYSIHSNPTDTTTLIPHLEKFKENYGVYPKSVIADAGYGSQENYTYLEGEEIKAFVKYNTFDQEQEQVEKKPRKNAKQSTKPFTTDKLFYQHKGDYFVCPMGQKMHYIGDTTKTTTTGFIQTLRQYQAKNCQGCPLNGVCHKAKGNRTIEINFELQRHRKQASKLLTTKEGIDKRKQRCHDVETVFGNIKQNHGFRRFMLRSKEKVAIEWGLLAIAQNIRKRAA
ncbi:IS1182 family transposase [Myroides odoratimimus]|uniref:IS1182 family transposase n=7 Tax=Myroides odoratimimus TaxID=76832 RepID=UPI000245F624|nr:IS1182 family transposase [Myroides odoratimimus]EHO05151.1 hypothetical protein HMPREF9714_03514 [Myroides odoratimimus CCUG 12901]EHO05584.1 hypothetical protein HMPREF9714_03256 [Myroides odoratimimus CCUG 12901]MCA4791407.1 IS1182 family transposase [Myroides odoratimimus]MCA4818667.1 IS1182 family transposase [Myroides odoratimimus]MDM1033776.1 IS1182 family transposase [Myroides odoratimimus]